MLLSFSVPELSLSPAQRPQIGPSNDEWQHPPSLVQEDGGETQSHGANSLSAACLFPLKRMKHKEHEESSSRKDESVRGMSSE